MAAFPFNPGSFLTHLLKWVKVGAAHLNVHTT